MQARPGPSQSPASSGGVGKSSLALNLAMELLRTQQRVCVLHADIAAAHLTILAGLVPLPPR